ncbi:STAS domain-containing protein [Streptomyces beihaiensis]|uniref:STAS domain-containing protein n=1 Tax=Streptomyces beihaiensis TaxID=2984495 RepID=A0ABT3TQQ0_9ACTN|nr:STAS domain-containing protein [Streptomyces beihaiensis]MCX3059360.1 STAS domain-containing protein [Streptomyces beihaiensis]
MIDGTPMRFGTPMSSGAATGLVYMDASPHPPVVVIAGPVRPGDTPALCERVLAARRQATGDVVCDVSGVTTCDLATVDALARVRLAVLRAGGRLALRGPTPGLAALLELTGLAAESGARPSGVQPVGDAEEREPALGVEEAVETGDPPP